VITLLVTLLAALAVVLVGPPLNRRRVRRAQLRRIRPAVQWSLTLALLHAELVHQPDHPPTDTRRRAATTPALVRRGRVVVGGRPAAMPAARGGRHAADPSRSAATGAT